MVTLAQPTQLSLSELPAGRSAQVVALELDGDESAWLAAFGLFVGQRLTMVRRALAGGPLHVRAASGGEFALARSLAVRVAVIADR
ncbi:MAG: ferrous iron transport protein A [Myxococcales bacterium]|nr:ferrous iron transport protein A [Myxococcales bacterium]